MRRVIGWRALVVLGAFAAVLIFGAVPALAGHGVAQAKSCASPTNIGAPYTCTGQLFNTVDTSHDTIEVVGLDDTVNASGGAVSTSGLLNQVGLIFGGTGTVTCTGGAGGAGTPGNPYMGATDCLLTFGANITTTSFSHYTVQPNDFNIPSTATLAAATIVGATTITLNRAPAMSAGQSFTILGPNSESRTALTVNTSTRQITFSPGLNFAHSAGVTVNQFAHKLTDTLTWDWNNTCTFDTTGDCTTDPQLATAGASTTVQKLNSTTATAIHDANHFTVTSVEAGATVHDSVQVSGPGGSPPPSGNVNIDFFHGTAANPCSGSPVNSGPVGPLSSGQFDATGFAQGPLAAGWYGFIAHYPGNGTYNPSDGPCEPLQVVDARITLTPATAVNEVNHAHNFTATVMVNDGTGFSPAQDGTTVFFAVSPPPATVTPSSCTTSGGSCTVSVNSSAVGPVLVHASTNPTVGGVPLHRETGDGLSGDSPDSQKYFVNANVQITPQTSVNEVNHPHTFLVTSDAFGGGATASLTSITPVVSPAGALQSSDCATPDTSTPNVATCHITVNSSTPGSVSVGATAVWHFAVGAFSADVTRTTGTPDNTAADGTGPATKYFVDANVSINPQDQINEVTDAHTFTVTSHAFPGGTTASLTSITPNVSPGIALQSTTCNAPDTSVANQATCTITVNSSLPVTVTIAAAAIWHFSNGTAQTDVTRLTGTIANANAGGSPAATKYFVDANVSVTPQTSTNEVNMAHTFTVTSHALTQPGVTATLTSITPVVSPAGALQSSDCATPDTSQPNVATCTITVNSPTPTTVTIGATAVWHFSDGTAQTDVTRTTGGALNTAAGGSGPATKYFVDANVSVNPQTSTNEVNHEHTFTVTSHALTQSGVTATLTSITPVVSPAGAQTGTTCNAPDTSVANQATCTITVNRPTAGNVTIGAIALWHFSDGTTSTDVQRTTGSPLNAFAGGSGPANKTFVDASIALSPLIATNAVNQHHIVTATVLQDPGTGPVPAAGKPVVFSISGGGTLTFFDSNTDGDNNPLTATTNASGQATVEFTSATPANLTINASTTFSVLGVSLTRDTNPATPPGAGPGGTGPATKTFVDAYIDITPATATNPINTNHLLTITVHAANGLLDAGTFSATATKVSGPGGFPPPNNSATCNYTVPAGGAASASCTVTLTSSQGGTTEVQASSDIHVSGLTITRTTGTAQNSFSGGTGDAFKTWASAKITIGQSATNEVGQPHTFTVTIYENNGSGYQHVGAGEDCNISLTGGGTPGATPNPPGPLHTMTDANGQCQLTFTSATAGTVTGNGTSTLSIGGQSVTLHTDATGDNSGPAIKTFVDASIAIAPQTAVNEVGHAHEFDITVTAYPAGAAPVSFGTPTVSFVGVPPGTIGPVMLVGVSGNVATYSVTINSNVAGSFMINAADTVSMGSVTVTRSTSGNSGPGGSGPATKKYVDANIQITPLTPVNEVGHAEVFTATVNAFPDGTGAPSFATPVVTVSGGLTPTVSALTINGNQATFTITINSPSAGTFTVTASDVVTMGGVAVTRTTGDGFTSADGSDSNSAVKNYVDANIQIAPSAVNEVGHAHTFTITVNALPAGTGTPSFATPAISFVGSPPGSVGAVTPVITSGNTRTWTVTINSNTAGTFTVTASDVVTMGGVAVTRTTDATHGSSGPATKNYVDANISIAQSATNEVGHAHTFTITVNALPAGTGTPAFDTPTVSFVGAPPGTVGPVQFVSLVGNTATYSVTINSSTPGVFTINATDTVHMGGVDVTRTTDSTHGSSGPATKTYVDANIQINPQTADNPVGSNHTLFGHVNVSSGSGFINAPMGTVISFSLSNAGGATATFVGPSSCTTPDASGTCSVVISSPTSGTTTIHATTTVSVGGISLTRSTGDLHTGDSGDATKNWHNVGSSVQTNQEFIPNDTVTLTGAYGTPTGSVTFELHEGSCSGTTRYTETKNLSGGTATTANTGSGAGMFTATGNHTWWWKVTYAGDSNNAGSTSCTETSTITEP